MKKKVDITNHILVPKHEKLSEQAAIKLLEKYFLKSNIAVDYLRNNPFPQVVYICKKN